MTAVVGVMFSGGCWTGTSPDLPGWVATSDNLSGVIDLVAAELLQRCSQDEPVNVQLVHIPARR